MLAIYLFLSDVEFQYQCGLIKIYAVDFFTASLATAFGKVSGNGTFHPLRGMEEE